MDEEIPLLNEVIERLAAGLADEDGDFACACLMALAEHLINTVAQVSGESPESLCGRITDRLAGELEGAPDARLVN